MSKVESAPTERASFSKSNFDKNNKPYRKNKRCSVYAEHLFGISDTILYEDHTWSARAAGHGTTDRIPDDWLISSERLKKMFEKYGK